MYSLLIPAALLTTVGIAAWYVSGRGGGRTLAHRAWRLALVTLAVSGLAVATYQKPQSFYTNFAMLPSLFLWVSAVMLGLLAVVVSLTAVVRGEGYRSVAAAAGLAVTSPVVAIAVIAWRAT